MILLVNVKTINSCISKSPVLASLYLFLGKERKTMPRRWQLVPTISFIYRVLLQQPASTETGVLGYQYHSAFLFCRYQTRSFKTNLRLHPLREEESPHVQEKEMK